MMAIFTLIFGRFAGISTAPFPYAVFVFAGLIPWTLFSLGFAQAALSLVTQQQLLTKVYFPRIFVPTAAAAVYVIDLVISLGLYAGILLFYHVMPSWQVDIIENPQPDRRTDRGSRTVARASFLAFGSGNRVPS
jgi:lipopolysaccharide transport system permease protein